MEYVVPPRVVVAEEIAGAGLERLREHCEVDVAVGVDRADLEARLAGAAGLVVRSATQVDADLIAAAPLLRVVGRAGIGVDNIDLAAATEAGVVVVNAPTANAVSAAEHTMALLLGQARRVPEADRTLRSGVWERSGFQGVELHGKTLGIVGLGRIGTLVAQRAAAFGMDILVYDPFVGADRARRIGARPCETLVSLLEASDFVTIHLPLTRETEGLIGSGELAAAKPGIRIVNTSRGGIIDEAALVDAIRAGRVAGAALDVFAAEPVTDSPLFDLPNVVVTPHLGAATIEAQDKAGVDVASAVVSVLRGELIPSAVNVDLGPDVPDELRPFLPLAERLGVMFVALAHGLPQELTVRAEGRLSELPSRPLALAALRGALSTVSDGPVTYVNAPLLAERRGVRVTEESTASQTDYVTVVRLSGRVGGEDYAVAGTIIGRKGPVLIEALTHEIELPFSPNLLMLLNADVPGMIGRVGTFLGDLGVNIDDMVVGRPVAASDRAMMGMSVSRPMTEGELDDLRGIEGVERAWFVALP
jgi:D-3-phosphoglycerate dehydrogenase